MITYDASTLAAAEAALTELGTQLRELGLTAYVQVAPSWLPRLEIGGGADTIYFEPSTSGPSRFWSAAAAKSIATIEDPAETARLIRTQISNCVSSGDLAAT